MPEQYYLVGKRFCRLLVISRAKNSGQNVRVNCVCDCGTHKTVFAGELRRGAAKSCGCLNKELAAERVKTHGLSKTSEYCTWQDMKQRCYNSNCNNFDRYGKRGISVCNRWINSFENFLEDMGLRPSSKYSIDRIDNDKGYSPDNCRWATKSEQVKNTHRAITITSRGIILSPEDWSRLLGGNKTLVRKRLELGWSKQRAVSTPAQRRVIT